MWKIERGTFYNNCNIRLVAYLMLTCSESLSKDSSDSVTLDGISQPLTGYNPHLALSTLNRAGVYGQVSVCLFKPGPVQTFEVVLSG